MPTTDDLLIRNIPSLKQELRIAAAQHGRTLREECVVRLSIAPPADMLAKPIILSGTAEAHPSNSPSGKGINDGVKLSGYRHNAKTCTVYGCLLCKELKAK